MFFGLTAIEFLAIDATFEIDDNSIAILGFLALCSFREFLELFGNRFNTFINLAIVNISHHLIQ